MVDVCLCVEVATAKNTPETFNVVCGLCFSVRFQVENCLSILSKWFFGAILAFIGKILWRTKQTINVWIFIFHFAPTKALPAIAARAESYVGSQPMHLNQIQCHTKEREESTERMALWLFYCQYRSFIRNITSNDPSGEIQMITGIDLNW